MVAPPPYREGDCDGANGQPGGIECSVDDHPIALRSSPASSATTRSNRAWHALSPYPRIAVRKELARAMLPRELVVAGGRVAGGGTGVGVGVPSGVDSGSGGAGERVGRLRLAHFGRS